VPPAAAGWKATWSLNSVEHAKVIPKYPVFARARGVATLMRVAIVTMITEEDERPAVKIKEEIQRTLEVATITKKWHIERVAILDPGGIIT